MISKGNSVFLFIRSIEQGFAVLIFSLKYFYHTNSPFCALFQAYI
jgi:hypothetical protein